MDSFQVSKKKMNPPSFFCKAISSLGKDVTGFSVGVLLLATLWYCKHTNNPEPGWFVTLILEVSLSSILNRKLKKQKDDCFSLPRPVLIQLPELGGVERNCVRFLILHKRI